MRADPAPHTPPESRNQRLLFASNPHQVHDQMLTKKAAARRAGISLRTLERYSQQGRIPFAYRQGASGKEAVFDEGDLDQLRADLKLARTTVVQAAPSAVARRTMANLAPPDLTDFLAGIAKTINDTTGRGDTVRLTEQLALSVKAAAVVSGIPLSVVRRAIADGTLTAVKVGGTWRIRQQDLRAWVEGL